MHGRFLYWINRIECDKAHSDHKGIHMKKLSAVLLLTTALVVGGGSAAFAKEGKVPASFSPKGGGVTYSILIDNWPN